MNIPFITQLFPFEKGNRNTSAALREFIEEWGKKGHQIKVIRPYFKYEKEPFPSQPQFTIGKNIEVEFIKPVRLPLLKYSFYRNNKIIRKLPFKPDIIIFYLYNAYFSFHQLARKLEVPLIIGIHYSDLRISHNRFHRWHQKQVFKDATAFACRSNKILKLFSKQFPEYKESGRRRLTPPSSHTTRHTRS